MREAKIYSKRITENAFFKNTHCQVILNIKDKIVHTRGNAVNEIMCENNVWQLLAYDDVYLSHFLGET